MIEIRKNDDGSLDEVVAKNCDFHLEQMSDGHWWMSVKAKTHPATFTINLYTKRCAKILSMIEAE